MSPPVVRVNTFVDEKVEPKLDLVSKIYITTELLCGINRMPVFGKIKPFYLVISVVFSLSINFLFVCLIVTKDSFRGFNEIMLILNVFEYSICVILGFAFRKKLIDFYLELNKFDSETGFSRVNKEMIKNAVQFILTIVFVTVFLLFMHMFAVYKRYRIDVTMTLLVHVIEFHFFGHLLSLLIPRLQFIKHLMNSSFVNRCGITSVENESEIINHTNQQRSDMKRLMDFYNRIIVAFDILNEAIKWQMILIVIICFLVSLTVSYKVMLHYIRGDYTLVKLLVNVTLASIEIIPMFGPCRVSDAVNSEVQCLIELLSSKLYENKIEKSSRPIAQAMLALMEARDLSFSLLRIFDIDISFPFKFLGLLVTYLIIMLQFEKVINIDRPTT